MADWLRRHPRALVVDVGCSLGFFSALALAASPDVEVIAVDSDPPSLLATEKICRYYNEKRRLTLIHGFVSDQHPSRCDLKTAHAHTMEKLDALRKTSDKLKTSYVCLHDSPQETIPTHSLDRLLESEPTSGRGLLIKCDVEGAELLVLQGAERLLAEERPTLLLSVHPAALKEYFQRSREDVYNFLTSKGYAIRFLSKDHEEHWLVEKV
ncbi:MAG: FkbM family methyltransferase [Magnetococcales bacterium]|nr:FkbM family methyltransferase [Magnetococcales bacterium]